MKQEGRATRQRRRAYRKQLNDIKQQGDSAFCQGPCQKSTAAVKPHASCIAKCMPTHCQLGMRASRDAAAKPACLPLARVTR